MIPAEKDLIITGNWHQILTLQLGDIKTSQSLNKARSYSKYFNQYYKINGDIIDRLGFTINGKIFLFGHVAFTQKMIQGYVLQFRRQYNVICHQNLPYLQLLDILFLFKKITPNHIIHSLAQYCCLIEKLSIEEKKTLVKLCRKYPVFDRLVLSYTLALLNEMNLSEKLSKTVNPAFRVKFYNNWNGYLYQDGLLF